MILTKTTLLAAAEGGFVVGPTESYLNTLTVGFSELAETLSSSTVESSPDDVVLSQVAVDNSQIAAAPLFEQVAADPTNSIDMTTTSSTTWEYLAENLLAEHQEEGFQAP